MEDEIDARSVAKGQRDSIERELDRQILFIAMKIISTYDRRKQTLAIPAFFTWGDDDDNVYDRLARLAVIERGRDEHLLAWRHSSPT